MARAAETGSPLQRWNPSTKVIHHRIVIRRVVHHKTADLIADLVLADDCTERVREVPAVMTTEQSRKGKKGGVPLIMPVHEVSDDSE
jgi:hypothetical protein